MKLHWRQVNDCPRVCLHRPTDLLTHGANMQPSLFTGVIHGHRHVTCSVVTTNSAKANN